MASTFSSSRQCEGLAPEARSAVNAAFDAMAAWRAEAVDHSEKGLEQVLESMAAAARALGWPDQVVEATCGQIQAVSKMQIKTIDAVMDAWEEQITSASPPSVMLSKLRSSLAADVWPGTQIAAMNPFLLYIQIMQQWQKACADASASWPKAGTT